MAAHKLQQDEIETPTHVAPYVEALGTNDALHVFLELGGSTVYIPAHRSTEASLMSKVIGPEKVMVLSEVLGFEGVMGGYVKVPLARRWVADVLRRRCFSASEIARKVRADEATARKWFRDGADDVRED